ncbi:hypothetical protein QE152_g40218 [Popillia japonica]|uniref:Uncharacterized protein n=1 Tax=Popillia japonica TaxID=7064 RepID=A0AAW1HRU9_POPJA
MFCFFCTCLKKAKGDESKQTDDRDLDLSDLQRPRSEVSRTYSESSVYSLKSTTSVKSAKSMKSVKSMYSAKSYNSNSDFHSICSEDSFQSIPPIKANK